MTTTISIDIAVAAEFVLPIERFDNDRYLGARLEQTAAEHRGALSTALRYLYFADGPTNLPKLRFSIALPYLDVAERVVIRWLFPRTNGHLRATYGRRALLSARSQYYRCGVCRFPDVRALHLDHIDGRVATTDFACLCANCHNIKSREKDWSGRKRYTR